MKALVFGTFDVIHKGHVHLLESAKKYGDVYVVVARDKTVELIKGFKPHFNELNRVKQLEATGLVHCVLLGHLNDKYAIIEQITPDVICLGYDQTAFVDLLKQELHKRNLHPKILRMKAFKPHIYKSSIVKKNKGIFDDHYKPSI